MNPLDLTVFFRGPSCIHLPLFYSLTPSIEISELFVYILPFLRTNYLSAWHSDLFQNFHRHMHSHAHAGQTQIQGKLGP